ncbi:MAG: hypothetical protein KBT69_05365 [Oceanihabitans sp.]|nr:hypothetical protein [Oceanihabitans sp.]
MLNRDANDTINGNVVAIEKQPLSQSKQLLTLVLKVAKTIFQTLQNYC